jgi:uncharacterized membrane protein YphA (DoxX/SURF4 family)
MLKNKNKSLSGRSLILNALAMLLNIAAVVFLVLGFHESYSDTFNGSFFKILGFILLGLSIVAITIFEGWLLFAYVSRVLVGGLFIVSGLIKANDPKGFAYKLEEYFEDGALAYRVKELFGWESFSLEFLIDQALMLSIIICILEILLGALIILGRKLSLASWLTLGMMVFFTLLTWHTKECDPNSTFQDLDTYSLNSPEAQAKIPQAEHNENITIVNKTQTEVTIREVKKPQCVDDCGCFGDALKGSVGRSLTPSESFWKDLVLLYFVLILFVSRNKITNNSAAENTVLLFFSLAFVSFFSFVFSWFFPIIFALTILLLALWIKRTGGKLFGNDLGIVAIVTGICALFVVYVLMYNPLKDYRPYSEGSNLREKMSNGVPGEYTNVLVYRNKSNQKDTSFTALNDSTKYIWGNPEQWKFVKRETITVREAILPSIQQFNPVIGIENMTNIERNFDYIEKEILRNQLKYVDVIDKSTGDRYPQLLEDFYAPDWDTSMYIIGDTLLRLDETYNEVSLADYILDREQIILVLSRVINKGNYSRIDRLKEIALKAKENNIDMIMISTASREDVQAFREKYGLEIPTIQNDETELKAMTRSNPTLIVMKKGTIAGKYPFRSTPSWEWLTKNVIDIK